MFTDELRCISEKVKIDLINAELIRAKRRAEEQIFKINEQNQRAVNVINQIKDVCLDRAASGFRNFEININEFLCDDLKTEEDPVYLDLMVWANKEGFRVNAIVEAPMDTRIAVLIKLEW